MKTLLALETSTQTCSVALLHEGQVYTREVVQARAQAQHCLELVEGCLKDAALQLKDCEVFAFGRGPGSFTGLRIGASCVQGLAFGMSKRVIPISSLQALAQQALRLHQAKTVIAAIDARMHEIYWGVYTRSNDVMVLQGEEAVTHPDLIPSFNEEAIGMGNVWDTYSGLKNQLNLSRVVTADPEAQDIAFLADRIGQAVSPADALPVYIRNQVTD